MLPVGIIHVSCLVCASVSLLALFSNTVLVMSDVLWVRPPSILMSPCTVRRACKRILVCLSAMSDTLVWCCVVCVAAFGGSCVSFGGMRTLCDMRRTPNTEACKGSSTHHSPVPVPVSASSCVACLYSSPPAARRAWALRLSALEILEGLAMCVCVGVWACFEIYLHCMARAEEKGCVFCAGAQLRCSQRVCCHGVLLKNTQPQPCACCPSPQCPCVLCAVSTVCVCCAISSMLCGVFLPPSNMLSCLCRAAVCWWRCFTQRQLHTAGRRHMVTCWGLPKFIWLYNLRMQGVQS